MTRRLGVLVLAVAASACAGSLEGSRAEARKVGAARSAPERCAALDDRRQFAGAIAKGAAVLGGASGLSTIPLDGDRYETARIGVAAAGVSAAAVAAGAVVVAEGAGESWARECVP